MEYDVNLNIHYAAPQALWDQVDAIYKSMPYWASGDACPHWIGPDIDIMASVEPSGIQIWGRMPEEIWESWYPLLKQRLTDALGYEIGEPEDGYEFPQYP